MKPSRKRSHQSPPNPFEAKWSMLSGTSRKKTSPFSLRKRHNVFADRRIAEDDPSLPEEDRYLARLQRERTRRTKKRALFSLHDEDSTNEAVPGVADTQQSLSLLQDDYVDNDTDDPTVALEEDGEEDSGDELLMLKKEGTEDTNTEHKKTHYEIMSEVMLKSKAYKARRQQEKLATDEQTAKLDGELPEIMEMLTNSGNEFLDRDADYTKTGESDQHLFDRDTRGGSAEESHNILKQPLSTGDKSSTAFHYEKVYQQLAAEKRARPSQRLPTEEEKAEEEMNELKRLEALRADRRSNAEELLDDQLLNSYRRKRSGRGNQGKRQSQIGGDDLDDGFDLNSPGDSEADDFAAGDEGGHVSGDCNAESSLLKPRDSGNVRLSKPKVVKGIFPDCLIFCVGRESTVISDKDVPFIFKECPSTSTELQNIFQNCSIEQRNLVLERIRKCFAVSLNPSVNQTKLEHLLACLLQRVELLAAVSADFVANAVAEMDMLLVHIHELGKAKHMTVSTWAKEKLAEMYCSLTTGNDAGCRLSKKWTVGSVMILRAIGRLFPPSDLRHPVSTPLMLLLSEALELKRMCSLKDVGLGILVGTILLEQMAESKRYCGQLVRFLVEIVKTSNCGEPRGLGGVFQEFRQKREWLNEPEPRLKASDIMKCEGIDQGKGRVAAGIVGSAIGMIGILGFEGKVGHMDIILRGLPLNNMKDEKSKERILAMLEQGRKSRKTMILYTMTGPKTTNKMLNPKFTSESGVFRRKAKTSYYAAQNGDTSASAARVRRALHKEERGYARDVRQAAATQNWERSREETERRERMEKRSRETTAFLEEQQATWNRAEKRQKKLSGKKW